MPADGVTDSDSGNAGRLAEFLELLKKQGVSRREVAKRAKVSVQYLSDVKVGGRTFTELFARRLAEEFGVDYRWLLGQSESVQPPRLNTPKTNARSDCIRLPVFNEPIEGDPEGHPAWDGTTIEVVGAAASRGRKAIVPYVLRITGEDRRGRLRPGDLVLVSQAVEAAAEIQIVKSASKLLLARATAAMKWEQLLQTKAQLYDAQPIGHLLGIVWGGNL